MATITDTSTNEGVVLRSLDLICRGDTGAAVDEIIHPESVNHRATGPTSGGPDWFRQVVRWINGGFDELSITPTDVIASGDKVVARTRFRGRHVGPFAGVPPTGRTVDFEQIHIWRLEGGRIVEHWACMDELAALRQLGVELPQG